MKIIHWARGNARLVAMHAREANLAPKLEVSCQVTAATVNFARRYLHGALVQSPALLPLAVFPFALRHASAPAPGAVIELPTACNASWHGHKVLQFPTTEGHKGRNGNGHSRGADRARTDVTRLIPYGKTFSLSSSTLHKLVRK